MTANETAYDMHKAGYSLKDIASHLNKEGYQRPFGARWDETAVQSAVVEHIEGLKQGKITQWRPDKCKGTVNDKADPAWVEERMLQQAVADYEKFGRTCPRRWNAKWGSFVYAGASAHFQYEHAAEYQRCKKENRQAMEAIRIVSNTGYDPATLRGTNSIYVY